SGRRPAAAFTPRTAASSNLVTRTTKETSFVFQDKRGFFCFSGQKQAKIPEKQRLEQSSGPFRPLFFALQR
ncbi:MAG: hypothetical protein Q4B72_15650, partial [Lachnospiraceae bacterium]|nr:hypothetical protein [Lachnospiraceae bacterium]